jgi:uncharacterized coiled-coil DUF342 family protein
VDQPESQMVSPPSPPPGTTPLDEAFQALWDRARRTADVIQQLREERRALTAQVEQLRNEVRVLQQEVQNKDDQIKRVAQEATASAGLGNGERQALVARAKDLLAKIEAYL